MNEYCYSIFILLVVGVGVTHLINEDTYKSV